jgi:hypothetical protein
VKRITCLVVACLIGLVPALEAGSCRVAAYQYAQPAYVAPAYVTPIYAAVFVPVASYLVQAQVYQPAVVAQQTTVTTASVAPAGLSDSQKLDKIIGYLSDHDSRISRLEESNRLLMERVLGPQPAPKVDPAPQKMPQAKADPVVQVCAQCHLPGTKAKGGDFTLFDETGLTRQFSADEAAKIKKNLDGGHMPPLKTGVTLSAAEKAQALKELGVQ